MTIDKIIIEKNKRGEEVFWPGFMKCDICGEQKQPELFFDEGICLKCKGSTEAYIQMAQPVFPFKERK